MTLADRVRLAREKRGMSQRDLAERAKLSSGYLSQLEKGGAEGAGKGRIGSPGLETAQALASALGVSLDWLATGAGGEPIWDAPTEQGAE